MRAKRKAVWLAIASCIAGMLAPGFGVAANSRVAELAQLSIEELISMKVTSVLKTPQPLSESPAAVHIVTQEDIRRSGADNIPDLLRMVPGVQVAELDVNIFAVSIRGFNDIHANKLLVMVDGRSVYNHIFSGVIWSYMDVFIEDIERIEVIRGPGSSVWGANAVNGVINIITKHADDTKGAFVEFGGGDPGKVSTGVRYGGDLTNDAAFRIYAKGCDRNAAHLSQIALDAKSDLRSGMIGFRTDWRPGKKSDVSLQGGMIYYDAEVKEKNHQFPGGARTEEAGASHLLGSWRRAFSDRSETVLQIYYQHEEREESYHFDVIDIDFQHDFEWSRRHHVVWGAGCRFISDDMIKGLIGNYTYDPAERELALYSFFLQDTMQLPPDDLSLTAGAKFEHNDYTGFEPQPSLRLSWTPFERHAFWAAASRAVRTPSRVDSDAASQSKAPPNASESDIPLIKGDTGFESENLLAYEIGYRTTPLDNLWFDIAAFYNVYDDLYTYEEMENGVYKINNEMEGETWGIEITIDYRPVGWWRLSGAWSFLNMDLRLKDDQSADLTDYLEGSNPRHQISLHSALDLGRRAEFDIWLRHVDDVGHMRPSFSLTPPENNTGDYTVFDVRLAWKPLKNVELSLIGRNLGGAHREFTNYEVEESVFFKTEIAFGE